MITRAQNKQILNKKNEQPRILNNDDKIKIMNEKRQKIKGKRGRPKKNNDKKLITYKRIEKSDENKGNESKINNIIYFKNSIQFRNDNIVHLINSKNHVCFPFCNKMQNYRVIVD